MASRRPCGKHTVIQMTLVTANKAGALSFLILEGICRDNRHCVDVLENKICSTWDYMPVIKQNSSKIRTAKGHNGDMVFSIPVLLTIESHQIKRSTPEEGANFPEQHYPGTVLVYEQVVKSSEHSLILVRLATDVLLLLLATR